MSASFTQLCASKNFRKSYQRRQFHKITVTFLFKCQLIDSIIKVFFEPPGICIYNIAFLKQCRFKENKSKIKKDLCMQKTDYLFSKLYYDLSMIYIALKSDKLFALSGLYLNILVPGAFTTCILLSIVLLTLSKYTP